MSTNQSNNQKNNGITEIKSFLSNLKPVSSYKEAFIEECNSNIPRISTGFINFDQIIGGGLQPEFYIMAAETGTGKSALMLNMAENIAAQKVNVLYFTLEMSEKELVARGCARQSLQAYLEDNSNKLISTKDILNYRYDNTANTFTKVPYTQYEEYSNTYFEKFGEHLYIIEGGTDGLWANKIANIAAIFKKIHQNEQLVVFIDYLQILRADPNDRSQSDRKTKTDISVTTLKTLSSQIGMPVIAVSSISRTNYGSKIKSNSFKESGDTEYTGGVLLGWNWNGVTDASSEEAQNEEIKRCKERKYREMTLEILKNRNGERNAIAKFAYFPAFNYIMPYNNWLSIEKNNPFNLTNHDNEQKNRETSNSSEEQTPIYYF